jgi:hypothetical protein
MRKKGELKHCFMISILRHIDILNQLARSLEQDILNRVIHLQGATLVDEIHVVVLPSYLSGEEGSDGSF